MHDLLTVTEVASLLRVPASWIYTRTADGGAEAIPHLKLGRHLRFRRAEVESWIERHHRGTVSAGSEPEEGIATPQLSETKHVNNAKFAANSGC
jgi:excisionase family DNA binding protein